MYICLFIGHLPFKPGKATELEAEENLWMMERETQRNGNSRENRTAVLSGTGQSAHCICDYHSCGSAVLSRLDCDNSLHTSKRDSAEGEVSEGPLPLPLIRTLVIALDPSR